MAIKRQLSIVDDNPDTGIRVAFTSNNREEVNEHFGSASGFAIYSITPESSSLIQVAEFGDLQQDGQEDKLKEKFSILDGCIAVYCRACGASALRQLVAMGIQPVKVSEGALIADLAEQLQEELRQGPSAWLAKAMRSRNLASDSRFDDMEAEGWSD